MTESRRRATMNVELSLGENLARRGGDSSCGGLAV
jgi:hypothetical protein